MTLSQATEANWKRLRSDTANKLKSRANKTRSAKIIYPLEYLRCRKNLAFAEKVSVLAQQKELSREKVIYSIGYLLLKKHNILNLEHVQTVLAQYSWKYDNELVELDDVPLDEWDILGFIYQCMQSEGEKNIKGSYFTPEDTAKKMLQDYKIAANENFLDPACGSGSFLLAANVQSPEQLWGCELDEEAGFIAKVNLLCKYKDHKFIPQIYQHDFLQDELGKLFEQRFDYIAANPPWGAKNNQAVNTEFGKIKDTFSLFLLKSYALLNDSGQMSFLLPQAILNVKSHKNIRSFMLNECCLKSIEYISGSFTGVMTGYVSINLCKSGAGKSFLMIKDSGAIRMNTDDIKNALDHIFSCKSKLDTMLIRKIEQQKKYDLAQSIFALGIVTGDNAEKLFNEPQAGSEAIYTGKEVRRYTLLPPRKYLFYNREQFQQIAPDEYYRAGEKLVYKFISKEPVFAYDNSGSLLLNSANMIIPNIPELGIKTVLALLNSEVLRYYYKIEFNDVKILKGNLTRLPLPEIDETLQSEIEKELDKLKNSQACDESFLQSLIYKCYNLDEKDQSYIKEYLNGYITD